MSISKKININNNSDTNNFKNSNILLKLIKKLSAIFYRFWNNFSDRV